MVNQLLTIKGNVLLSNKDYIIISNNTQALCQDFPAGKIQNHIHSIYGSFFKMTLAHNILFDMKHLDLKSVKIP